MIEFMVLAAPRSGTAWAANWLTTETTHCLHDPLFKYHYNDLDGISSPKRLGLSCTGLAMFQRYLVNHPAPKVVVHRRLDEVNASLREIGLPELPRYWNSALDRIQGLHVNWTDLFDKPELICHYLRVPFDAERHALLRTLNVQLDLDRVKPNRDATQRLLKELVDTTEFLG